MFPGGNFCNPPAPWAARVTCAYWRRPEAYLDPDVRAGISSLAVFDDAALAPGLERLRADVASGAWHERHAALREQDEWDWGYRLFVR